MQIEIPSFQRSMKTFGAMLITLSVLTPASSIFVIAPGVIQQAGSGAFLSFVAGAIACLFTALVYAELSSAFPVAGGEYTIVGRVLGPLAGFIVLGLSLTNLILVVSVLALGVANYLDVLVPNLSVQGTAIATVILGTFSAILNIRTNAIVTGIFLALELIALFVISVLGLSHAAHPLGDLITAPVHLGPDGALEPASFGVIGLATSVAIFAYNGYGSAVYLGEETHDAPRHIARAILNSLAIGVIAEAVPVAAVLMGAPDYKALFGSNNPFGDFVATLGGPALNVFVSLSVALAIVNANIASILMAARVLFSSGRDHVWTGPINHALTRIHARHQSPWVATLICGFLSAAACLIPLDLLLVVTGTVIVVIYAALCVAALVGRSKRSTAHAHYRMTLYPLPPILGLVMMLGVIYANWLDEAIGRPSLYVTVAVILLSAGYYALVLRRRGQWELRLPQS